MFLQATFVPQSISIIKVLLECTLLCSVVYILPMATSHCNSKRHSCNRDHRDNRAKNIYYLELYRKKEKKRKKNFASSAVNRFKYTFECLFQLDVSYFLCREINFPHKILLLVLIRNSTVSCVLVFSFKFI